MPHNVVNSLLISTIASNRFETMPKDVLPNTFLIDTNTIF
jgi:hypothetical protein